MEFEKIKSKRDKILVENCLKLKVGNLPKRLLHQINKQDINDVPLIGEERHKDGRKGSFIIKDGTEKLHLTFAVDLNAYPPVLRLEFTRNPNDINGLNEQEIELETRPLPYGFRWYFTCKCGNFCSTLYLLPNSNQFVCRRCGNLTYELCTINKKTFNGQFYYISRLIKLFRKEEQIRHRIYKGEYTKRMRNFMKISQKWGKSVEDEVKEMAMIKIILASKRNHN